jgi:hypothetical protein
MPCGSIIHEVHSEVFTKRFCNTFSLTPTRSYAPSFSLFSSGFSVDSIVSVGSGINSFDELGKE